MNPRLGIANFQGSPLPPKAPSGLFEGGELVSLSHEHLVRADMEMPHGQVCESKPADVEQAPPPRRRLRRSDAAKLSAGPPWDGASTACGVALRVSNIAPWSVHRARGLEVPTSQ